MKLYGILALLPVASLFGASPCALGIGDEPQSSGLQPAVPTDPEFDPTRWRSWLTEEDLDRRESSYADLIEEARRNPAARRVLRDWAQDAGARELAWTSRLALRELERSRDPFARFPGVFDDWDRRRLGLFRSPFDGVDAFGLGSRDLLREIEESFGGLFGELDSRAPGAPLDGWDANVQAESLSLQSGPDGVRVELEKRDNGDESTTVYEAESLEELLEENPELKERIGFGAIPNDTRRSVRDLMERLRGRVRPFDGDTLRSLPGPVPTDKLGVLMREPGQYTASLDGLKPGVGLLVERVLPGTLAAAMGVHVGDILLELDGAPLRSGADVAKALSDRQATERIELEILDAGGLRQTLDWQP